LPKSKAEMVNSPKFDPTVSALVNVNTLPDRGMLDRLKGQVTNSKVEVISYKANSIELNVKNDSPSLLVTSEVYYPGWKVYVDGKKDNIIEVNGGFRGVILNEGEHIIKFNYVPTMFTLGCVLLLLSCFICIAIFILLRRERQNYVVK